MTAGDRAAHGLAAAGVIVGSFAGASLRAVTIAATEDRFDGGPVGLLVLSVLGGVALGSLLGAALRRRRDDTVRILTVVALIAAIGSYGAAAALVLVHSDLAPWPFWRDAAVNIGATVLAARVAVVLFRSRH